MERGFINMLVFVYGSLKLGNRLNPVLSGDTFICHTKTADKAFDLIGGGGFPFMIRADDKLAYYIKGDLYDVSEHTLKRLDEIEGYLGPDKDNFYTRETILVKHGDIDEEAFVYLCDTPNSGNTVGITVNPEDSSKEWRHT
jgi:gamma-glutamylcyclotransferase (GGCT)/AIG2-like uncharacterized protein YtfP